MNEYERDFRLDDITGKSRDQQTWREFAQKFGIEPYVWLCNRVNGGNIYVREIDSELRPARLRAYPVEPH